MTAAASADAVFVPGDGPGTFLPTEYARGPWSADAQHGGAPAALLAHCVEQEAGEGHRLARLTVEFLRPVPLTALQLTVTGRAGRSAGRWEATVTSEGATVATARAVTVAVPDQPLDVPTLAHEDPPPVALAEDLPRFRIPGMPDYPSFYADAMAPRVAAGTVDEPGEATAWFGFRLPLLAGADTRPASLAAATADFCNGLSWVLPLEEYLFSNADVSVNLWRAPIGAHVGLAARTTIGPEGTGVATGQLFDTTGVIGQASQTLVVRRR
ncbi:thioesterase family protein [Nocardioides panacisoli]|uniref:thioesterase family protein n=1 Tax=Nocardioides panacisoli TaxID=627624 RepID=UPI001C635FA5|nr:thioesterase family protein [Nocardioides panacisoli]QYJ03694.1 thioesterase family protein [Nocardioides panacisoli]